MGSMVSHTSERQVTETRPEHSRRPLPVARAHAAKSSAHGAGDDKHHPLVGERKAIRPDRVSPLSYSRSSGDPALRRRLLNIVVCIWKRRRCRRSSRNMPSSQYSTKEGPDRVFRRYPLPPHASDGFKTDSAPFPTHFFSLLVRPVHADGIVNASLSRILLFIWPPVAVNILHFLVYVIDGLGGGGYR